MGDTKVEALPREGGRVGGGGGGKGGGGRGGGGDDEKKKGLGKREAKEE